MNILFMRFIFSGYEKITTTALAYISFVVSLVVFEYIWVGDDDDEDVLFSEKRDKWTSVRVVYLSKCMEMCMYFGITFRGFT